MGHETPTGYSASVRLWMECGDHVVPLSHTARDFVIADAPVDLPPGDAIVVVEVDGTPMRRDVTLPGGMSTDSPRVSIRTRSGLPF
jgi:hypothetical protein